VGSRRHVVHDRQALDSARCSIRTCWRRPGSLVANRADEAPFRTCAIISGLIARVTGRKDRPSAFSPTDLRLRRKHQPITCCCARRAPLPRPDRSIFAAQECSRESRAESSTGTRSRFAARGAGDAWKSAASQFRRSIRHCWRKPPMELSKEASRRKNIWIVCARSLTPSCPAFPASSLFFRAAKTWMAGIRLRQGFAGLPCSSREASAKAGEPAERTAIDIARHLHWNMRVSLIADLSGALFWRASLLRRLRSALKGVQL